MRHRVMRHPASLLSGAALAVVLLALSAEQGWAQEAAADNTAALSTPDTFTRGPGFYISIPKTIVFLMIFWAWAALATWVSADTQKLNFDWQKWNLIVTGTGVLGIILFFAIPIFWVGMPLFLLAVAVPVGIYVKGRNDEVPDYEQVFTPSHLRYVVAMQLRRIGIKVKAEQGDERSAELVKYTPKGAANDQENQVNLLKARQNPHFKTSMDVIADAVLGQGQALRARQILFELTPQHTAVRYFINGMWEQAPGLDAATGQAVVGTYLQVSAQNPTDFRNPQRGKFKLNVRKQKFDAVINTQPVKGGARALLELDDGSLDLSSLEKLGMDPQMISAVQSNLAQPQGLFIVAAPPGAGMSTLFTGVGHAADRYTRHYVAVEDVNKPEPPVDNVEVTTYDSTKGETPATVLPKLIRLYPDAYMVRHIPDAETLRLLLSDDIAGEGHVVITAVRAKEAVEAPLRLLTVQDAAGGRVPPAELAPALLGALTQRIVRRLCEACKQPYEPQQQLLQQLGLRPEQAKQFFRPPMPDPQNPEKNKCPACNGRGYVGQIGIFELLVMNDHLKQVLAKTPRLDVLRQEARKAGMRTLQQDAIRLVVLGITSMEEATRALKS